MAAKRAGGRCAASARHVGEQCRRHGGAEAVSDRGRRQYRLDRQVLLQLADERDLSPSRSARSPARPAASRRCTRAGRLSRRARAPAGHVQVDADLEQAQRLQGARDPSAPERWCSASSVRLQVGAGGRGDGDGVPEVEGVVALVVVADAGVLVDEQRPLVQLLRRVARGRRPDLTGSRARACRRWALIWRMMR